jgi:3-isopropylmalate/(R)-2-methylmalate dehydratase small subunit
MSDNTPPLFSQLFSSTCCPLGLSNVDTDQVIPARFLKGTSKLGLGKQLFADWRLPPGSDSPDTNFPLNDPRYQHAGILLAGHNFGCGSSREHAPWALLDYGFRVVLAVSFGDIFKNNALKNGLLPLTLPEALLTDLLAQVRQHPCTTVSINLQDQTITIPYNQATGQPQVVRFELDAYRKNCLLKGLDDIGYTLTQHQAISAFEAIYNPIGQTVTA